MGPDRDRTRDPWICSQTHICSQTRYQLRYAAWYDQVSNIFIRILFVTKFHKILIKIFDLRGTSFKMVNLHKQRAITLESIVRYRPLLNLNKTSWT